jgi:hypothetical protein
MFRSEERRRRPPNKLHILCDEQFRDLHSTSCNRVTDAFLADLTGY